MKTNKRPVSILCLRQIAVTAQVDPRTAERVLRGLPTRETMCDRVLAALETMGLDHLVKRDVQHANGARR